MVVSLRDPDLSPETLLQLAPGVRTRFDVAGHVLLDAPNGTVVDLGPRGYAALSLFARPLALGDEIERLEREAPSTEFAPTMNVLNMLIEEGALVRPDAGLGPASGWADPVEHARMLHDDPTRAEEHFQRVVDQGDLRPLADMSPEVRSTVASLKVVKRNLTTGDGVVDTIHEVKLWDKLRGLEMLAKHFGLIKGLHQDQELFDKAYGYVREYY